LGRPNKEMADIKSFFSNKEINMGMLSERIIKDTVRNIQSKIESMAITIENMQKNQVEQNKIIREMREMLKRKTKEK
jgi:hypothetical protein